MLRTVSNNSLSIASACWKKWWFRCGHRVLPDRANSWFSLLQLVYVNSSDNLIHAIMAGFSGQTLRIAVAGP